MKDFIDKTSTQSGTPINRENLMAMQGFVRKNITFSGSTIIEKNPNNNETITTTFKSDGSIVKQFTGQKTITKTTTFNTNDGSITEVIS